MIVMEFSILDCFMISFFCGFVFGLVYELFRFIRRMFPAGLVVMICDICFFVAAGLFVFELSMYLGNFVRLYTLLGFGAGLFAYIQTVGRLIALLEMLFIRAINATIGALFSKIFVSLKNTIGIIAHNAAAAFGRFYDFSLRSKKSASSLLHFNTKRVYNVKRNIESYGESIGGNNGIQVKIRRSQ